MEEITDVNVVVDHFNIFLGCYEEWREENGLSATIDNPHEILASMADKLGRICRYVKHQERNDPKHDWPEGMTTEMVGLLTYMTMLINKYDVNISEGMKIELEKSVEQHGNKNREG